jgi:three-Cys-motif partner protein
MPFGERPVQTKVKHILLEKYGGAWTGIIANGVRRDFLAAQQRGVDFTLDLVYVDGFGGYGQYTLDFDGSPGPIWGSPILGVRALEGKAQEVRDLPVRVSAVVTEQKAAPRAELLQNLHEAGLHTPIAEAKQLTRDSWGKVTVLGGDFRQRLDEIIAWLGDGAFALFFVDPWGASMRMDDTRKIVGRKRTDAIILFPYYDLEVHGGSAAKPEEDRTTADSQNISVRTAHFGTDRWIEVTQRGLGSEKREDAYTELYLGQLRTASPNLIVKNIPLQLGVIERTAYHLYLVTRHSDGAMRMNDLLRDAEVEEKWICWRGKEARSREASATAPQTSFAFDDLPFVPPPNVKRVAYAPEDVAPILLQLAAGAKTVRGIYIAMADELYTTSEIHAALRFLKERGQAHYERLTPSAWVRVGRPAARPLA